jgi:hypothetical protein
LCDFEVKVTIYISKTDGQIRPKKLNFVLRRFPDSHDPVIYGKLTLDVARYYRNREAVHECVEMESGRSVAPILNATFLIVPAGLSTDGFESDQSYVEELAPRHALAEWDRTEVEPAPEEEPPAPKKRKKKHHRAPSDDTEPKSTPPPAPTPAPPPAPAPAPSPPPPAEEPPRPAAPRSGRPHQIFVRF